ncbi:unnamed protein product [Didymodactylos carnosus]|uniref:Uncharacterized protein n=1 Tax=Didymodactylos carnosus TaxID=1234261 RepID=A0A815DRP6_9BILA|nr:unnamed protein product [Didymodactylos carnosus]CAF4135585.1 unnamed protein product [Didymodactylos carnosus]
MNKTRLNATCQVNAFERGAELNRVWSVRCTATIQASDRKQTGVLVRGSAAELKALIDSVIENEKTLTKDAAKNKFEEMWKKKIDYIESSFNVEEQIRMAIKFGNK